MSHLKRPATYLNLPNRAHLIREGITGFVHDFSDIFNIDDKFARKPNIEGNVLERSVV